MRRTILVLVGALALTGCPRDSPPDAKATVVTTPTTVPVSVTIGSPGAASTVPATTSSTVPPVTYQVTNVIDGDTIDITASDGVVYRVRLLGIDAPEMLGCEALAATETLAGMIYGQQVDLPMGPEDQDIYGRYLRFVELGGQDIGLVMIQLGLAKARYDVYDGYLAHGRDDAYRAADDSTVDYSCEPPETQPRRTSPPPPVLTDPPVVETVPATEPPVVTQPFVVTSPQTEPARQEAQEQAQEQAEEAQEQAEERRAERQEDKEERRADRGEGG